jgi:hypothetical protein
VTQQIFSDPIVDLAALCPLCALAALNPVAALMVLSPTLRIFNPAINPNAALLAFSGYHPQTAIGNQIGARIGNRLNGLTLKIQLTLSIGG